MIAFSGPRRRWDLAFALVLVAVFGYSFATALGYPEDARLLPLAVALPGLALAAIQVVLSLRPAPAPLESAADEETLTPRERTRRTAEAAAWILGIFLAIYLIGFLIAVPVAAVAYLRVMAREGWVASLVVAVLCWALVFGIFDRVLHIPLPTGQLFRLFGVS